MFIKRKYRADYGILALEAQKCQKGQKVPSVDLFVELRERFGASLDYIVLGVTVSEREQELQNQLELLRKELKEMQNRIHVMLAILGESA